MTVEFSGSLVVKRPILSIYLLLIIVVAACKTTTQPATSTILASTPTKDKKLQEKWYSVYFTDPDSPTAGSYRGGPDDALAQAIRRARLSVDIAITHLNLWSIRITHLNLWSIRDALIAAHDSGVNVRVVVESDNLDEVEIQELKSAGIEVLDDRRESYMHHKFVVIDKSDVCTGSMNFTINGAYYNDNNLICIRSSPLAENYTTEFEEMFITDMFGDDIILICQ
jgi:phosphatidylserine/phosphatidylglycerophosphate/cardiolipin synthase-like enzyme